MKIQTYLEKKTPSIVNNIPFQRLIPCLDRKMVYLVAEEKKQRFCIHQQRKHAYIILNQLSNLGGGANRLPKKYACHNWIIFLKGSKIWHVFFMGIPTSPAMGACCSNFWMSLTCKEISRWAKPFPLPFSCPPQKQRGTPRMCNPISFNLKIWGLWKKKHQKLHMQNHPTCLHSLSQLLFLFISLT